MVVTTRGRWGWAMSRTCAFYICVTIWVSMSIYFTNLYLAKQTLSVNNRRGGSTSSSVQCSEASCFCLSCGKPILTASSRDPSTMSGSRPCVGIIYHQDADRDKLLLRAFYPLENPQPQHSGCCPTSSNTRANKINKSKYCTHKQ